MKKYTLPIIAVLWSAELYAQTPTVPIDLTQNPDMPLLTEPVGMPVDAGQNNVNGDVPPSSPALFDDGSYNGGVDTRKSLAENLRQTSANDEDEGQSDGGKNWVGQLFSNMGNEGNGGGQSNPLTSVLTDSVNQNQRSNASVFDISGVMLRMSYQQAEEALLRRGYKRTMQKLDIPNFIRWRNEEKCRAQGVVGYERLEGCVIKLARDNKYQYVSQAQFNKYDTQETVNFFLTSNFTHNKVYKITYRTEAANNTGNSAKAIYLRNIKVFDFWKKISQKYGTPDNKEEVVWGLGNNKPYLKAATGLLLLEDPMLKELDYTRMSREDQLFMNTDLFTF